MTKVRKAVIPAAGLGTRFLPATKALAKEMLPIVDKPTIQFIVEEALKSGTNGVGGIGLNNRTYVVYKYTVGEDTYIVKPLVLNSNALINLNYTDSTHTFCITYFGPHSGSHQTNYRAGENITVAYLPENPKAHQIVDDKDKAFFYKGFRIAGFSIISISIILLIASFFVKNGV